MNRCNLKMAILKPNTMSLPDDDILNLSFLAEYDTKKLADKMYASVESYIKRSNYKNLDEGDYDFRNDYLVEERPTTISPVDYALPGKNELRILVTKNNFELACEIFNQHRKFKLQVAIFEKETNTEFKLFEIDQPFNHDTLLLSKPALSVYDGFGELVNSEEVLNTKFSIRITKRVISFIDSNNRTVYTYRHIPGNQILFKIISEDNDNTLQSGLIISRRAL